MSQNPTSGSNTSGSGPFESLSGAGPTLIEASGATETVPPIGATPAVPAIGATTAAPPLAVTTAAPPMGATPAAPAIGATTTATKYFACEQGFGRGFVSFNDEDSTLYRAFGATRPTPTPPTAFGFGRGRGRGRSRGRGRGNTAAALLGTSGQLAPDRNLHRAPDCNLQRAPDCNLQRAPDCNLQRAPDCNLQRAPDCNLQRAPVCNLQRALAFLAPTASSRNTSLRCHDTSYELWPRQCFYNHQYHINKAPRKSYNGDPPDDLPPLSFHGIHSEEVRLSRDSSTARCVEPFCDGVTFSARPVCVNEKVCVRLLEMTNFWNGGIIFGFTAHDPYTLLHTLFKIDYSYLRNMPGNWASALGEQFCEKDNILHYYVNFAGDVYFGINGEDIGVFFSGVNTSNVLWALIVVNENCIGVQFIDPRAPNQIRRSNQSPLEEDTLMGSMGSLSMEEPLPLLRCQSEAIDRGPSLHRSKGRNVQFINNLGVEARTEAEVCQGYVFTAGPMRLGQTIVVQILATETAYPGRLTIGLTSCDPAMLNTYLPDHAQLLDKSEYWVMHRVLVNNARRADELAVTWTLNGEIRISRNESSLMRVIHLDHALRLWAFVDINGPTQRARLLISHVSHEAPPQQLKESTECTICCDGPIDSVLYMCGHMCMCYQCAVQQWKHGGGRCPMCRAQIGDVIRTYKP